MLSAIYETPVPKLVLIEDTVKLTGQNLFLSLINIQSAKHSIIVLCLEKHPSYYKEKLKNINNINFIDCFTNFNDKVIEDIELVAKSSINVIVVFDSIIECYFLMTNFYNYLRKLLCNKSIIQIIALLHIDCLPSNDALVEFDHLSNAVVKLTDASNNRNICSLLIKRPGRKVIRETISCWVDENNVLHSKKYTPEVKKACETPVNLPADLSTFRIELSETEKKSRDQVVLPYTQMGGGDGSSSGTGKIIYELEVADDWDEEDPDDDLDV